MNWIKPIHTLGDKNLLSYYQSIMVHSVMTRLYSTIMEQKMLMANEHVVKQALDQNIQLSIVWLHSDLSWKKFDFKGKR